MKSVTKPVPHTKDMFLPICLPNVGEEVVSTMSSNHIKRTTCDEFEPEDDGPHVLNQSDLNDLVRDFNLSKLKAEILGSRLKQWNLLHVTTRVSKSC